jgi:hypothetical protein
MKKYIILMLLGSVSFWGQAAVLNGVFNGIDSGAGVNLTDVGGYDWVYWNSTTPTNMKLGSPGAISGLSPVGLQSLRAPSSSGSTFFSYTDGTSPASETDITLKGAYNTLNAEGSGLSVSITLPTTDIYTVTFVGMAYNCTAQMTATLDGATTFVDSSFTQSLAEKWSGIYTFTVQPDEAGAVLKLDFINLSTVDSSAHVRVQAVAVDLTLTPRINLEFILSN